MLCFRLSKTTSELYEIIRTSFRANAVGKICVSGCVDSCAEKEVQNSIQVVRVHGWQIWKEREACKNIWYFVLYGGETWSLTLREEHS
jgi:dissimilatory sulfite reductase (desulfoviridin) alpha/beta subunit